MYTTMHIEYVNHTLKTDIVLMPNGRRSRRCYLCFEFSPCQLIADKDAPKTMRICDECLPIFLFLRVMEFEK